MEISTPADLISQWNKGQPSFSIYSSGSTGSPRKISWTRAEVIASARATAAYLNIPKEGTGLLALPVQYTGGFMALCRYLIYGYEIVTASPEEWNKEINVNDRFTLSSFAPLQLQKLREQHQLSRLENIGFNLIGGGSIDPVLEKMLEKIPTKIYQTFGMTETLSHFALRAIHRKEQDFTTLPGVQIAGTEEGELVVSVDYLGITKMPTRDQVEITGPNTFRWLGRTDDVINSGGVKIHPQQVEKKILPLLGNQDFFLAKKPDERFGEKVVLVLEGEIGTEEQDRLRVQLEKSLSRFERPKEIVYQEKFRRTKTGKIIRKL